MRVLFVAPIEQGSGETITAVHMGEDLVRSGHEVRYLASKFARRFIEPVLPGVSIELSSAGPSNIDLWCETINDFSPDATVFADYSFMSLPFGVAPLGREPGWPEALDQYHGCLITLDHFGFAQQPMGVYFGPAHLTPFQYHNFSAIPERMEILLPCPMHEPGHVRGRRGHAFRYWEVPLSIPSDVRADVRRRYLVDSGGFLVFHTVPNWAWQAAELMQIYLYDYLPDLLDHYLGDLPRLVTVVSVNNGDLLDPLRAPRLRIVNLPPISISEFEALLLGSDLVITENRVSISLGKALCGFQVCGALVNRQRTLDLAFSPDLTVRGVVSAMEGRRLSSVYPFEVFPSGMAELLQRIILYRDNSLTTTFCDLEIFGGENTGAVFRRLLTDNELRTQLRSKQEHYLRKLARLPSASEIIRTLSQRAEACHA
jgi:hypothetical protein